MSNSLGFVIQNVELKIIDLNTGETVGPYQKGEFCIRRPGMLLYYYDDPKATPIDEEGDKYLIFINYPIKYK